MDKEYLEEIEQYNQMLKRIKENSKTPEIEFVTSAQLYFGYGWSDEKIKKFFTRFNKSENE